MAHPEVQVANHKQAAKRARQDERRRQRNMAVKSRIRTRVRALRYAVDQLKTLEAGRTIHPQDVEKHLRGLTEGKSADLTRLGFGEVTDDATKLLSKYDAEGHAALLKKLAKADLKESTRLLSKAASKGVLHKRTVSRRISRLTKMVDGIEATA